MKRCSENMVQICRRKSTPKCGEHVSGLVPLEIAPERDLKKILKILYCFVDFKIL